MPNSQDTKSYDDEAEEDRLEEELYAGSLSKTEIIGYFVVIVSMLALLVSDKLDQPTETVGWLGFGAGILVAAFGTKRRLSRKSGT